MSRENLSPHKKNLKTDIQGSITIEAAVVLPIVITMIFGILQFAFAYNEVLKTKTSMNAAIRKILLLQDPSSGQMEQILNDTIYTSQKASITTSISYETKYGSDYANINAVISYSLPVPFTEGLVINKNLADSIVLNK